jgi:hypothetical protein
MVKNILLGLLAVGSMTVNYAGFAKEVVGKKKCDESQTCPTCPPSTPTRTTENVVSCEKTDTMDECAARISTDAKWATAGITCDGGYRVCHILAGGTNLRCFDALYNAVGGGSGLSLTIDQMCANYGANRYTDGTNIILTYVHN